jgi:hypothetical protein
MVLGDLKIICKDCGGTGLRVFPQEAGVPAETCQDCQGSGYRAWGSNNLDDLVDKVNNIAKNIKDIEKVCDNILKIVDK